MYPKNWSDLDMHKNSKEVLGTRVSDFYLSMKDRKRCYLRSNEIWEYKNFINKKLSILKFYYCLAVPPFFWIFRKQIKYL